MNLSILKSIALLILLTPNSYSQNIPEKQQLNNIFEIVYQNNFDKDTPGPYKEAEWRTDWNNPKWANNSLGYGEIIQENTSNYLQIKLPKGKKGLDSSGVQWHFIFKKGYEELYLSYRVKFSPGFRSPNIHGKLPGFSGGASNTGGKLPNGKDGWSTRYMFHGTSIFFYIYYPDMNKDFGDSTPLPGKIYYGAGVNLTPGYLLKVNEWYTITQRVVMNTTGYSNGLVEGFINGKLCARKTGIRFRDIPNLKIDRINFGNFLGGSGNPPINDEFISFDDFVVFAYNPWVDFPHGQELSAPDKKLVLP